VDEHSPGQLEPRGFDSVLQEELKNRGIVCRITSEGQYYIYIQGRPYIVNLEDIRREYERDCDPEIIIGSVESRFRPSTPDTSDFPRQVATHMFGHFRGLVALSLAPPVGVGMQLGVAVVWTTERLFAKVPRHEEISLAALLCPLLNFLVCVAVSILLATDIWSVPRRILGVRLPVWRFLVFFMVGVGIIAGVCIAWPD
jgi:hypothetical protein